MKSDTFSQMAYNQTEVKLGLHGKDLVVGKSQGWLPWVTSGAVPMSHRARSRFSEVNLLLLRAEHISDAGGASVITVVRKGKKPVGQL